MDSLNKHLSQPRMDILLAKYIIGEASAKEVSEVMQWSTLSESNKKHVEQLQIIWKKTEALGYSGTADPVHGWQNFLTRISTKHLVLERSKLSQRRWLYAAAVLLIAGIWSAVFIWQKDKPHTAVMINHFSGSHLRTDTLPDGSIVVLRQNSGLSFPTSFPPNQRNISLTGDASFSVTHDPNKPFSVAVKDITVTVLGTRFEIASSMGRTEITVQSGMVGVTGRSQRQTLRANEKLIVPPTGSLWIKQADTFTNADLQKKNEPDIIQHNSTIIKQIVGKPVHALMVGDKVPILPLDKWIKGGQLNVYDQGKVYLVDFWALWCGPCIAGMEGLSSLQKKYKNDGLEVMGVTSEDEWGNSYEKVYGVKRKCTFY